MKQLEIVIQNQTGLHARPAKVLVNLAKQFKADVNIQYGQKRVNAKSMVSVLTLGAIYGSQIMIQTVGEDEELALACLEEAIRNKLGDVDAPVPAEAQPMPVKAAAAVMPLRISTPGVLQAVAAAPGIAIGPVFHFRQAELKIDDVADQVWDD